MLKLKRIYIQKSGYNMEKTLINDIVKISILEKQVIAVLNLLEENNTVPFIARYRKEATGGLDEVQIKQISDEYQYVAHLQKRKRRSYT